MYEIGGKMNKQKPVINPNYLFIWLSIYMVTAVPAYYIIYRTVPWGLVIVLLLEEITSYYLLDDQILEFYMEQAEEQSRITILLSVSVLIMFISLISLLFHEWRLCVILVAIEVLTYSIRKLIKNNKSSRNF